MRIDARRRGSFLGALFGQGIPVGLAAVKERARTAVQAAVKWLLGMGVDYLVAAALAIVSLALLVGAAVDGLAAAGVPEWAASLILAAVSGGLAFLYFQKGKKRTLEEARRTEEGRADAPSETPRTVTLRIVREKRTAEAGRPRAGTRAARPPRRSRTTIRVTEGTDVPTRRRSEVRR